MNYWRHGNICLYHSDFRGVALPEKVECVVTSPPYNIGKGYDEHDDALSEEEYSALIRGLSEWCWDNTELNGHVFLNVGHTCVNPLIAFEVLEEFASEEQWELQNRIIWVKSLYAAGKTHGHFKPINSERFLNDCFEEVFHFTKSGNSPIDRLAIGVPYEDKSNESRWESAGNVRCRGNVWFVPYETISDRGKKRGGHPATFPVALPEMCAMLAGAESMADPMVGTGSTVLAARRLDIRGYGVDVSSDYLDFAIERICNEEARLPL